MIYVIVNALLYVILLLCYVKSRHKNILGLILMLLYTTIAIMAIPRYFISTELLHDLDDVTLEPFIYLFLVFIMFTWYFCKVDLRNLTNIYAEGRWNKIYILMYIYILSTIVVFYLSVGTVISNISSGEWAEAKKTSDELKEAFNYNFFIEQLFVVFNTNIKIFMVVISFFMLMNDKRKCLALIVLMCFVLSQSMLALKNGSRGTFVIIFISIIVPYLILKKDLPIYLVKRINKILFISLAVFVNYFMIVTVSRFGDLDSSYSFYEEYNGMTSLLSYAGQSFLHWNVSVYPITDFGYGVYGCEMLFGNEAFMNFTSGTRWITKFYTFVGSIYVDIGPYLTFVMALFVFLFSLNILKLKHYSIEGVCFFSFVYVKLFVGAFSWAENYVIEFALNFIVYLLLKTKFPIAKTRYKISRR